MRNIMRNSMTLALCAAAASLTLAGCDKIDPMSRPYVWHPTDVNQHNIAAMVDNPEDLIAGRETQQRRAFIDTGAVYRLMTGTSAPLLSIYGGPGGGGGGGAASGGGTGGGS
jgi:type IV pilus biogenesis protein CpaD/CtpE